MSETLSSPFGGSSAGAPEEVVSSEELAEVVPIINATGLAFNKVSTQELVDYIGQTAISHGVEIELGWSPNYGIVYLCPDYRQQDAFNELIMAFEDSQPGTVDINNCSGAELLNLVEVPEGESVSVVLENEQPSAVEIHEIICSGQFYYLETAQTERASSINKTYGISSPTVTARTDKINKYNFAGYLIESA